MNRKEIQAVFFDAAGTLIYLPRGVGYHYRLVAQRHGLNLDEARLDSAFRAVWKQMPAREITGISRPDDDKEWWRSLVRQVMDYCGIDDRLFKFDEYFGELYQHFAAPDVWQLYPDVMDVISGLRGKYRLGVISNFDKRLRTIFGRLDLTRFFEKIIISSEAGVDKPDPRIFEQALFAMNLQPAMAIHVGDDPVRDWHAAAAAGMHVFRLNPPENSLADLVDFLNDRASG